MRTVLALKVIGAYQLPPTCVFLVLISKSMWRLPRGPDLSQKIFRQPSVEMPRHHFSVPPPEVHQNKKVSLRKCHIFFYGLKKI